MTRSRPELRANIPAIRTDRVTKRFGGVLALADVSLEVLAGRIHCVIGPNGAGKTTLFNVLSGVVRPTSGRVYFEGTDITESAPDDMSRRGLLRTFQTPRPFLTLSVGENVLLALSGREAGASVLKSLRLAGPGGAKREEAGELLNRVGLNDVGSMRSADLTHGHKRRLELAMALACRPKVLLLDEPTAGMNAHETEEMSGIIRTLAQRTTAIVIEHDLDFVRRMADYVTVLHQGRILCEGTVSDVEKDDRVRNVYLGGTE